jgi:glucokinase
VLGVPELEPSDLEVIAPGERDPSGPIGVIGAGTGLGEGIGIRGQDGLVVLPSEGGHCDFAARDELEIDLFRFLQQRHHKRISIERAVSGPGLVSLYDFVIARGLERADPDTTAQMQAGDPAAVIGQRGDTGEDAACARAVSLFMSLYGSEAGNFALKVLPTGGLYIAGGIAPKLIRSLRRGEFMRSMLDKGRMSPLLARMPVAVVMNPSVPLLGARSLASMLYRTSRAR